MMAAGPTAAMAAPLPDKKTGADDASEGDHLNVPGVQCPREDLPL